MIAFLGLSASVSLTGLIGRRSIVPVTRADLPHLPDNCRLLVYRAGREAAVRGGDVTAGLRLRTVNVLAIVPVEELAFRDLVQLTALSAEVHGILEGEALDAKVVELTRKSPPSTEGRLLALVAPNLARDVWPILGAAALLGRNRVAAGDLAKAIGAADRTVRRRLDMAGVVTPRDLPAYFTGAHLAADFQLRGISLAAAARNRGFRDTDHLRHYLLARTGATPKEWAAMEAEGSMKYADRQMRIGDAKPAVDGEKSPVGGEDSHGI